MRAMEISRTALDVEWRRLEIIAQNLANADVPIGSGGGGYRSQQLLSGPRPGFETYLDKNELGPSPLLSGLTGVAALGVETSSAPPRIVHEPGSPLADTNGNVAYPAIDHAEQMTSMIKTSRVYQANVALMTIARQMYTKALEIGRRS
jgi:flagellar basal-body rod protein FlgC